MNKMKKAVSLAYNFLSLAGEKAKAFAEVWGWRFGVILIVLATLMAISFGIKSYTLLTITGIISALLVLVIHYAGDSLTNLITAGAKVAGKFQKPLEETAIEAKKLFRPLITVSMVIAFLAC
jgi:hypothetical protein